MSRANLRRGLAAGAIAGVLAGLVGVLASAHTIDVAEERAHAADPDHGDAHAEDREGQAGQADHADGAELFTREQARIGLVGGTVVGGLALGALLGVASGPAARRLRGDAWSRTWKLGAAATGAVVVLPALHSPPLPPGVADPDTIGARTAFYVATVLLGLAVAVAAAAVQRPLRRAGLARPARQAVTGAGVAAAAAVIVALLPSAAPVNAAAAGLPAELVWTFRLESLATQLSLWLGVTAVFGLLAVRAEQGGLRQARGSTVPAEP